MPRNPNSACLVIIAQAVVQTVVHSPNGPICGLLAKGWHFPATNGANSSPILRRDTFVLVRCRWHSNG